MRKLSTYSLNSDNSTATVKRGEYVVTKGTNAPAARIKMRFTLANASGSPVTLTDAQRKTFLQGFDLTLRYGARDQHKPYSNASFRRLRTITRHSGMSEWEGYTATNGLAGAIPAGGNLAMELWVRVPMGLFRYDTDVASVFGVGTTQARTVSMEIRRLTPSLPASITISGGVTLDVYAEEVPSKHDRWVHIPRWHEYSEDNRVTKTSAGLPLALVERTTTHTASTLTDCGLSIDGLSLYDKVSVQDVLAQYLDTPAFPSEGRTDDEEVLLYSVAPGQQFEDMPTGSLTFEQNTQTLGTMQLGHLYIPTLELAAIREDVKEIARIKGRNVFVTNLADVLGLSVPSTHYGFVPWAIFDEGDAEADLYPSLACAPGGEPAPYIPAFLAEVARARIGQRQGRGEYRGAERELQTLARAIPGAVPGTRGFASGGSAVLEAVRGALAK